MHTTTARSPESTDLSAAHNKLNAIGQSHVLTFAERLATAERALLLAQVGALDATTLPALIERYVKSKPGAHAAGAIEPAPFYAARDGGWDRAAYRTKGIELIGAGKVAAFTVAGGQGSRLGYEGPKGCYPAGAVTSKPLFACLADWIIAAQNKFCASGAVIPWYIMTSPINHQPTVDFFKQHRFFGLREQDVMFFPQGVLPSLEMGTGRLLLNQPHEIAVNPDGHGGSLRALHTSGALDDMAQRGVQHISYTQIDNPLVRVIDPTFIGLHAFAPDSSAQMSSKMVRKAHAGEKVGVFCSVDGRTSVIEYSDLPEALSKAVDARGTLRFLAGSIAVHVISVEFVRSLNTARGGFSLELHRAEKKVPYIDLATGKRVEPAANNAVKLEAFVFDALPLCQKSIVLETDRTEEFAPIKNADAPGAADSPRTCREIQTQRAARWLSAAGCRIPYRPDGAPDCVIELSPQRAMEAGELSRDDVPMAIAAKSSVVL